MSELKLLPCPFCGGEAAPYHVDQCEDEGEPAAFVMCNLCNAQVPWSPGLGAIFAWNRRPTPDPEAVARAIYAEMDQQQADPWDEAMARSAKYGITPPMIEIARRYARAAIAAMEGQPKEQPHDR